MTRTQRLRQARNWPQHRMADYLGVSQPTVTRLEAGQPESGPISRLLDLLDAEPLPAAPETDMQPAAGASAGATDDAPAAFSGEAA